LESSVSESAFPPSYAFGVGALFFIRYSGADDPAVIERFDLATRAIKPVLPLGVPQRFAVPGLSVSPDGRWFLGAWWEVQSDLMRFENFR